MRSCTRCVWSVFLSRHCFFFYLHATKTSSPEHSRKPTRKGRNYSLLSLFFHFGFDCCPPRLHSYTFHWSLKRFCHCFCFRPLRFFPFFFFQVGSEALERVARALGARAALPVCRQLVKEGLAGWAWQQQHAALSALGILADGKTTETDGVLLLARTEQSRASPFSLSAS